MSLRLLAVFMVAIGVAACAVQQQPLDASAAANLKGRRLAMAARPPAPAFVAEPGRRQVTPYANGLSGGWAKAAVMSDAGTRIFRENGIADPATHIAQQLRDDLRHRYGLQLDQEAVYITNEDPKEIAAGHPTADLLLDVWVDSLSLEPVSPESSSYGLKFNVYLRLIDAKVVHLIDGKKGVVIASGTCSHVPKEMPSSTTYEELLADGAQRLKHELDLAAQSCVDVFRTEVLTAAP